jgi:hypothetical protein
MDLTSLSTVCPCIKRRKRDLDADLTNAPVKVSLRETEREPGGHHTARVRQVRVVVCERCVGMRMGVRLAHRFRVSVPVVLVMHV